MKFGIYYAYWEKHWGADYRRYIEKAAKIGFDILEISCASLPSMSDTEISELRNAKERNGITLTAGYGPKASQNIASSDIRIVDSALAFWEKVFKVLYRLDVHITGGGLYCYWPVDYTKPVDKEGDLERSMIGTRKMAEIAGEYDIDLCMEVLNRHEGYLLNTAQEGVDFVNKIHRSNVKVMLDTYHMNMEEDDMSDAIYTAGSKLGHFHIGENNRRLPGQGTIIRWSNIAQALKHIGYEGAVVMEPFVQTGGQVGNDIKVWRDISRGATEQMLDDQAGESLNFIRETFKNAC
ncbi:MAG: sugar phosphate isomerase/epimerase family protein [Clostridia bacterium]